MDKPIRYMQRTRDWYLALGYDNPYRWAHFDDVVTLSGRIVTIVHNRTDGCLN